ncbi:MAG: hypothetical protein ABL995_10965 [Bryobacteraceae bacterium]
MQANVTIRALFVAAALHCGLSMLRAETIDRLAATVGMHVIAESETIADVRIAAFIDKKPPVVSGEAKQTSANRLIDQYLVLQDAALARAPLPTASDVGPLLEPIRARYASVAEFATALSQAGITEEDLRAHLLAGLQMMRYSDLRFRPEVQISEQELHEYYDQLKPKLGSNPPDFDDAREEVERLLTGERTLQGMDRWLGMTRHDSHIVYYEEAFR